MTTAYTAGSTGCICHCCLNPGGQTGYLLLHLVHSKLGHIVLWGGLGGYTPGSLGDVLTGIWGDPVTLGPHRPLIGWFSHRCEGQCVSVQTSCILSDRPSGSEWGHHRVGPHPLGYIGLWGSPGGSYCMGGG